MFSDPLTVIAHVAILVGVVYNIVQTAQKIRALRRLLVIARDGAHVMDELKIVISDLDLAIDAADKIADQTPELAAIAPALDAIRKLIDAVNALIQAQSPPPPPQA